jgi:hypothetical protein
MKRSEMIKKLYDRFYYTWYEDGNGIVLSEQVFSDILDYLEEEGMRPPYDASQDDGVDTFEWEPECE